MEQLLDKIYLESNKMRFGDMHNAITDYFDENNVDHAKYIIPDDSPGSETSMFILGIFSFLRTFKNHPDQRAIVKKYIDELCKMIDTTYFIEELYELPNILDSITSFFSSNDSKDSDDSDNSDKEDEFEDLVQNKSIRNQFNRLLNIMNKTFRNIDSDIIIQLTIPVLAFENVMVNMDNEYIVDITEYITNIKDLLILTEEYTDFQPNYRGYIEF
jgi:hypothetical protein